MTDLRQTLVDLIAASRKGAESLEHTFIVAVGEKNAANGRLAGHTEFLEAIERAEQGLKAYDEAEDDRTLKVGPDPFGDKRW